MCVYLLPSFMRGAGGHANGQPDLIDASTRLSCCSGRTLHGGEKLQAHAGHQRQGLVLAVRAVRRAGPPLPVERRDRRRLAEAGLDGNAPRAARAYALVYAAHYEGYIASQDAKYHYWTARPNQFDPSITTVVPTPNFPTYVSNAATIGMTATLVLGHLFPREANRYQSWAQEFGESRLWAGIHFRSDIEAGWEIGRRVAAAFVERAQHDGAEGQNAWAKSQ